MPVSASSRSAEVHFPSSISMLPEEELSRPPYVLRYARSREELRRLQEMRFEVFNIELGEGLDSAFDTRRDEDRFDLVCHHILVCEAGSDAVVGTYRLQTSEMARQAHGFYSASEFDLTELPAPVLDLSVEIGRACVAREHRSLKMLYLLWTGIARYMVRNDKRYLFGCASLSSQDPLEAYDVWQQLRAGSHLHPSLHICPQPGFACLPTQTSEPENRTEIPRLMRAYLSLGARICGPPAIDREFKTIDFLAIFDMHELDNRAMEFFGYHKSQISPLSSS